MQVSWDTFVRSLMNAGFLSWPEAELSARELHGVLKKRVAQVQEVLSRFWGPDDPRVASSVAFLRGEFTQEGWQTLQRRFSSSARDALPPGMAAVAPVPEAAAAQVSVSRADLARALRAAMEAARRLDTAGSQKALAALIESLGDAYESVLADVEALRTREALDLERRIVRSPEPPPRPGGEVLFDATVKRVSPAEVAEAVGQVHTIIDALRERISEDDRLKVEDLNFLVEFISPTQPANSYRHDAVLRAIERVSAAVKVVTAEHIDALRRAEDTLQLYFEQTGAVLGFEILSRLVPVVRASTRLPPARSHAFVVDKSNRVMAKWLTGLMNEAAGEAIDGVRTFEELPEALVVLGRGEWGASFSDGTATLKNLLALKAVLFEPADDRFSRFYRDFLAGLGYEPLSGRPCMYKKGEDYFVIFNSERALIALPWPDESGPSGPVPVFISRDGGVTAWNGDQRIEGEVVSVDFSEEGQQGSHSFSEESGASLRTKTLFRRLEFFRLASKMGQLGYEPAPGASHEKPIFIDTQRLGRTVLIIQREDGLFAVDVGDPHLSLTEVFQRGVDDTRDPLFRLPFRIVDNFGLDWREIAHDLAEDRIRAALDAIAQVWADQEFDRQRRSYALEFLSWILNRREALTERERDTVEMKLNGLYQAWGPAQHGWVDAIRDGIRALQRFYPPAFRGAVLSESLLELDPDIFGPAGESSGLSFLPEPVIRSGLEAVSGEAADLLRPADRLDRLVGVLEGRGYKRISDTTPDNLVFEYPIMIDGLLLYHVHLTEDWNLLMVPDFEEGQPFLIVLTDEEKARISGFEKGPKDRPGAIPRAEWEQLRVKAMREALEPMGYLPAGGTNDESRFVVKDDAAFYVAITVSGDVALVPIGRDSTSTTQADVEFIRFKSDLTRLDILRSGVSTRSFGRARQPPGPPPTPEQLAARRRAEFLRSIKDGYMAAMGFVPAVKWVDGYPKDDLSLYKGPAGKWGGRIRVLAVEGEADSLGAALTKELRIPVPATAVFILGDGRLQAFYMVGRKSQVVDHPRWKVYWDDQVGRSDTDPISSLASAEGYRPEASQNSPVFVDRMGKRFLLVEEGSVLKAVYLKEDRQEPPPPAGAPGGGDGGNGAIPGVGAVVPIGGVRADASGQRTRNFKGADYGIVTFPSGTQIGFHALTRPVGDHDEAWALMALTDLAAVDFGRPIVRSVVEAVLRKASDMGIRSKLEGYSAPTQPVEVLISVLDDLLAAYGAMPDDDARMCVEEAIIRLGAAISRHIDRRNLKDLTPWEGWGMIVKAIIWFIQFRIVPELETPIVDIFRDAEVDGAALQGWREGQPHLFSVARKWNLKIKSVSEGELVFTSSDGTCEWRVTEKGAGLMTIGEIVAQSGRPGPSRREVIFNRLFPWADIFPNLKSLIVDRMLMHHHEVSFGPCGGEFYAVANKTLGVTLILRIGDGEVFNVVGRVLEEEEWMRLSVDPAVLDSFSPERLSYDEVVSRFGLVPADEGAGAPSPSTARVTRPHPAFERQSHAPRVDRGVDAPVKELRPGRRDPEGTTSMGVDLCGTANKGAAEAMIHGAVWTVVEGNTVRVVREEAAEVHEGNNARVESRKSIATHRSRLSSVGSLHAVNGALGRGLNDYEDRVLTQALELTSGRDDLAGLQQRLRDDAMAIFVLHRGVGSENITQILEGMGRYDVVRALARAERSMDSVEYDALQLVISELMRESQPDFELILRVAGSSVPRNSRRLISGSRMRVLRAGHVSRGAMRRTAMRVVGA